MFSNIYGIDFSGGKKAGKKIWISEALIDADTLLIQDCKNASDYLQVSTDRDAVLASLVSKVLTSGTSTVFALDFPFSIAESLVMEDSWEEFIMGFPIDMDPRDWREDLMRQTNRKEIKRQTDFGINTPFNSFNLRIYMQTFFGISKFLYPLLRLNAIHVIPMGKVREGKPKVIEICPASTLKEYDLYIPYKGKEKRHFKNREVLLSFLDKEGVIVPSDLKQSILDDTEGDGLDAILASFTAYRNIKNDTLHVPNRKYNSLGGHIYI